jgi:hypothetical protein
VNFEFEGRGRVWLAPCCVLFGEERETCAFYLVRGI